MTSTAQPRIRIDDLPETVELTTEEMDNLYGAGRFRPMFEQLEDRCLMTATVNFGGLEFRAAAQATVGANIRLTGPVEIGLPPASGAAFQGLLKVQQEVDLESGTTFIAKGNVTADTLFTESGLLFSNGATFDAGALLSQSGYQLPTAAKGVADMPPGSSVGGTFDVDRIRLVQGELDMAGRLPGTATTPILPSGLDFWVKDPPSLRNRFMPMTYPLPSAFALPLGPEASLDFQNVHVNFTPTPAAGNSSLNSAQLQISGSATLQYIGGINPLQVTLGTSTSPGLVITDGHVNIINAAVWGSFTVGPMSLTANNLTMNYSGSGNLMLTGGVSGNIGNTLSASLNIVSGGLSINTQTGYISLDTTHGLELNSTALVQAGGQGFGFKNVDIKMNSSGAITSASGTAEFGAFALGGSFATSLGHLTSFSVNAANTDGGIPLGDTGLSLTAGQLSISNLDNLSNLTISVSATVAVDGEISVNGHNTPPVTGTGTLSISPTDWKFIGSVSALGATPVNATLDLKLSSFSFNVNGSILQGAFTYNGTIIVSPTGVRASGTASLNLPSDTPGVVQDCFKIITGGTQVVGATFQLQFLPGQPASQDFASVTLAVGSTPIVGVQFGLADGSLQATGPLGSLVGFVATTAQNDAVAILKGYRLSSEQLAHLLKDAANLPQAGVAVATWASSLLANAGYTTYQIGVALSNAFVLKFNDAVNILYKTCVNDVSLLADIINVVSLYWPSSEGATVIQNIETVVAYMNQYLGVAANELQYVLGTMGVGFQDIGSFLASGQQSLNNMFPNEQGATGDLHLVETILGDGLTVVGDGFEAVGETFSAFSDVVSWFETNL